MFGRGSRSAWMHSVKRRTVSNGTAQRMSWRPLGLGRWPTGVSQEERQCAPQCARVHPDAELRGAGSRFARGPTLPQPETRRCNAGETGTFLEACRRLPVRQAEAHVSRKRVARSRKGRPRPFAAAPRVEHAQHGGVAGAQRDSCAETVMERIQSETRRLVGDLAKIRKQQ